MPRRSYYIGCSRVDFYEVGRDPRFFEKGMGFAWKYFLANLAPKFVKEVLQLDMKPGEIRRITKLGSLKTRPLTTEEQEEIRTWKKTSSTRKT